MLETHLSTHEWVNETHSVVSDSLQPHRLYSPWNSPGKNTGVGNLSLLQGIFPTQGSNPGLPHCRRILYQLSFQGSRGWWQIWLITRPILMEDRVTTKDMCFCLNAVWVHLHTSGSISPFLLAWGNQSCHPISFLPYASLAWVMSLPWVRRSMPA